MPNPEVTMDVVQWSNGEGAYLIQWWASETEWLCLPHPYITHACSLYNIDLDQPRAPEQEAAGPLEQESDKPALD
jgi:hypothetical protein